jgi:glyoxylase-like metal-dependent hydrolase (beta-lactamase superfamily II)
MWALQVMAMVMVILPRCSHHAVHTASLAGQNALVNKPLSELRGIQVFERGWLSSNNVLLHDGDDAVLVDSSHVLHAPQTVALVRQALGVMPPRGVVNTHLHADHCGGNASLQRAFACRITIPPGQWQAVQDWDEVALSYAPTGQRCERFVADDKLLPGQTLTVGKQRWQALAAPGHDPHSLILFNDAEGVVITADALWQRGFGVIFPELDGQDAFDEAAQALDLIESLQARIAIPGHGAPFNDLQSALAYARQRLAGFRASPQRHARYAMKALVKFHLLEEQQQAWPALLQWFTGVSLYDALWQRMGRPDGTMAAFAQSIVDELCTSGALFVRDGVVFDH